MQPRTNGVPWEHLRGAAVLVTGATGLVGGALARALSAANKRLELSLRIVGHGRDAAKGRRLSEETGAAYIAGDIRQPIPIESITAAAGGDIGYIIHCAAITTSRDMASKPADVMLTSAEGTLNTLELAKDMHCKSYVYVSSMEAYGRIGKNGPATETDMGWIDLTSPRGSYPESKRYCECLCAAYTHQYGVPAKAARLAMTFGAWTPDDPTDTRAPMQFARQALAGEDITLHTTGETVANCCDTEDAARALLTILLKGANGGTYNIANPAAATIREMAETASRELSGGKAAVKVEIPEDIRERGYAPRTSHTLSADKLMALGWRPGHDLAGMFRRMAAGWGRGRA